MNLIKLNKIYSTINQYLIFQSHVLKKKENITFLHFFIIFSLTYILNKNYFYRTSLISTYFKLLFPIVCFNLTQLLLHLFLTFYHSFLLIQLIIIASLFFLLKRSFYDHRKTDNLHTSDAPHTIERTISRRRRDDRFNYRSRHVA